MGAGPSSFAQSIRDVKASESRRSSRRVATTSISDSLVCPVGS
jgi:hypothetical protein